MVRDITIGQFYPVQSAIHSLDPRTKIIMVFIYIAAVFMVDTFWGYGFILVGLFLTVKASNVPMKYLLKGLKGIMIFLMFSVILNVFFVGGETLLFQWGFVKIYKEGILMAIQMGLRLILLVVGSSVLTLTTSPIRLTDGIESLLSPFKKIGVPAHEIAMMMSIALRFIPILLEETDKIMKAQTARGAEFDKGNIIKRAKAYIPILVPLFISAFTRADELAMAMEARCYHGGAGRTKLNPLRYQRSDGIAIVATLIFGVLCWLL
ncbi:energy-coupling factor transporter transmembrane component T family protein [Candidatus Epulonipiscium viviparus]|uniref:energy-coupling factor transporter transmembrane component T family protein n=1 Tax=Candidatus Epulonipiscium viviparus TaxID=420336 RepID=UPI00016BFD9C|nr:energy-coupling factor transporter transmembrane component T [Candidatus Epulopiscium viviparus]